MNYLENEITFTGKFYTLYCTGKIKLRRKQLCLEKRTVLLNSQTHLMVKLHVIQKLFSYLPDLTLNNFFSFLNMKK